MGGSVERSGRMCICDGRRTLSVRETGGGLSAHVLEDIPDPRNDLAPLSLPDVHCLEKVSIAFPQVKDIAKYPFDDSCGSPTPHAQPSILWWR